MGKLFKEPSIKYNFMASVSSLAIGAFVINSVKKKTHEKKAE